MSKIVNHCTVQILYDKSMAGAFDEGFGNSLMFQEVCREYFALENANAALREENDLQRHSIQQLSAQVAELREGLEYALEQWEVYADEGLCDDDSYLLDTDDMEGVKYREIAEILSRPNPGADLLAKMEKLEAVAAAAKELLNLPETSKDMHVVEGMALHDEIMDRITDALAALDAHE